MFGQNNDNQNQPQDPAAQNPMFQNSNPPADFMNAGTAPAQPAADPAGIQPPAGPADFGAPMIMDSDPTDFTSPDTPAPQPAVDQPQQAVPDMPAPVTANVANDELLSMKQEALQQLTPLVSHLDQTPEDKFRTVMMMIQASDDHTKLGEAFDIAKQITDDKARAQALLDVINEINYFTQHSGQ